MSTGWRSSSHCTGGECVEVGQDRAGVLVRDTDGTVLTFTVQAWEQFTARLKTA